MNLEQARALPAQSELRVLKPEEYFIEQEPYYEPVGDEIAVFKVAYRNGLPILPKGPTGCGKTRLMEYMAWRLKRPLITVSCHMPWSRPTRTHGPAVR